jgi:hypothetical protein
MPEGWPGGRLSALCVPEVGDWSGQTECQRSLDALGVVYRPVRWPSRVVSGQRCEVQDPIYVWGRVGGVSWRHAQAPEGPMLVGCPLALALHRMGAVLREEGVEAVIHLGTTHCRTLRTAPRLSQHAFGMAVDVAGFVSGSMGEVSVARHWERGEPSPRSRRGALLWRIARRLHEEQVFQIVLTPEYNEAHHDHLHLDLTPGRHFLSRGPAELLLGD